MAYSRIFSVTGFTLKMSRQYSALVMPRQITDAQSVVQMHIKEIEDAWNHHFGG